MNYVAKYLLSEKGNEIYRKWTFMPQHDYVSCPVCECHETRELYALGSSRAVVCKQYNMKYVSPQLSDQDLSEYYTSMHKDDLFKRDFEGREHDMFNNQAERQKKIKDRRIEIGLANQHIKNGKVLDIGAGTGLFLRA